MKLCNYPHAFFFFFNLCPFRQKKLMGGLNCHFLKLQERYIANFETLRLKLKNSLNFKAPNNKILFIF
jgi:hypothetical protein